MNKKLAENEATFRLANERAISGLEKEIDKAGLQDESEPAVKSVTALYFYCECADETCTERIRLTIDEYQSLHRKSTQFIVLAGHVYPEIERVVKSKKDFLLVEKYEKPPRSKGKLHKTE